MIAGKEQWLETLGVIFRGWNGSIEVDNPYNP